MKGIYVLVIQLSKNADLNVGKLGNLHFDKGLYAYVGSAQTALEKRIERHRRREKRFFWHIDYLLRSPDARIVKVFIQNAAKPEECTIARKIAAHGEAVAGFGCSDCRCKSHLFRIEDYDFLGEHMQEYAATSLSAVS